jgi:hypothetical protein
MFVHETHSILEKLIKRKTDQLIQSKIGSKNFITNIIAWISWDSWWSCNKFF